MEGSLNVNAKVFHGIIDANKELLFLRVLLVFGWFEARFMAVLGSGGLETELPAVKGV